jgi:hypothetical protein
MDTGRFLGGLSPCGIVQLSKLDLLVLTPVDAHDWSAVLPCPVVELLLHLARRWIARNGFGGGIIAARSSIAAEDL